MTVYILVGVHFEERALAVELGRSGFREVSTVPSDAWTLVGRNLEQAIDFQLAIGPPGEIVREAGLAGQQALPALRSAVGAALEPYLGEDGVRMSSAAWLVHARP
jgi:hypothetical protein